MICLIHCDVPTFFFTSKFLLFFGRSFFLLFLILGFFLFGVLLVTLQFVLYTQLRAWLGVAKTDLTLVWDALSVLRVVGQ